ncbi:MAG: hemerythrin domain-containing protein [Syntrophobacteraceae bacterium]|jgi:hemerythrin-like domain-containing protein
MMPVGPLMIEHRLIERMIRVIGVELIRMEEKGEVNPGFVDVAVDFIRTYTDSCHHGKEEDILFRDLRLKPLTGELERILYELIEDHRKGREAVAQLVKAKEEYLRGESEAVSRIIACLRFLVEFYPKHIEKEDRHFFLPCMGYFTKEEKDAMLKEEMDFDRNFVHVRYKAVVESAERR